MSRLGFKILGWFLFLLGIAIPIPLLLSGAWYPLDVIVRLGLAIALIWGGWKLSHRRKHACT